jgi:cell wall assembly regulator SMI1
VTDTLLLELNEVNFDFIIAYAERGELPTFAYLLDKFGYSQTSSEHEYEHLEPWIQWVTAHTGKTFAQHGVFRLGDIDRLDGVEQIWERLQREKSITVGAIAPMNACNRIKAGFFVPDPWTATPATGSFLIRRMSSAISRVVNANAEGQVSVGDAFWLGVGAVATAQVANYAEFLRLAFKSVRQSWMRAIFLDLLLADTFIAQTRRSRPGFASLFLNGAAHIQHHYLFSSPIYAGPRRNPSWYLAEGKDPLLAVYRLYDRIVKSVLAKFPRHRVMLATGLHQDPYDRITYYWRLRDHASFLRRAQIPFADVHTRMSRDFLVVCRDAAEALHAMGRLAALRDEKGVPIFEIDNRGTDLFVTLTYPDEIREGFAIHSGAERLERFDRDVVFVALKNGKHNGIGYFLDTGSPKHALPATFPLTDLPEIIARAV